jgi:hypothetical protein
MTPSLRKTISKLMMACTVFGSLWSFASSCGNGIDTPGTLAKCDSSLTFETDISAIVASDGAGRCAQCHSGRYDSLAGIRKERSEFLKNIKNGSMPPGGSQFKDSTDGAKVIAWASCATLK